MYNTRLRVEEELAKKFKEQAEKESRSFNNMVMVAMSEYLNNNTKDKK